MKVTYSEDKRTAWFNDVRFRLDAKTGYYLAGRVTHLGRRERLHCYIWRFFNGEIPDGYVVHHRDENKAHNDIGNLVCIPKQEHMRIHSNERVAREYDRIVDNITNNARPKAVLWHGSEAGRMWHSEHARDVAEKLLPRDFVCEHCGKTFSVKPFGVNKYCSNKCRAAARRKSGADNETRECVICGKRFVTNKYSRTKCCGAGCSAALRQNQEHSSCRQTAGL